MKRAGILLLVLIGLGLSSQAFAVGNVKWYTLKEGMEKAKAEKKPVIVDFFFGKGCPRCEFLEKEVYSNPAIAKKIMDGFVPIMIDLTKKLTPDEEKLGNKYEFKSDCLLIFLDYEENLLKDPKEKKLCFIDKIDPEEFIQYLDSLKANYPAGK